MKNTLIATFVPLLFAFGSKALAQSEPPQPKTTDVLVIATAKEGVTRQQIMAIMPQEIRATVRLYLEGKIRQWYSRGDGKGVVFILNCGSIAEAQSIMDGLPLSKAKLMDDQFVPMSPLVPLGALLRDQASQE